MLPFPPLPPLLSFLSRLWRVSGLQRSVLLCRVDDGEDLCSTDLAPCCSSRLTALELVELLTKPVSINGCPQSPNMPERDHRPGQQRNRLLQFRVGVIAVLAAHRLVRLGRQCCRCFVAYDSVSAGNGILVCTGGLKLQQVFSAGELGGLGRLGGPWIAQGWVGPFRWAPDCTGLGGPCQVALDCTGLGGPCWMGPGLHSWHAL